MIVLDGERAYLDDFDKPFECPCCRKPIRVFYNISTHRLHLLGSTECELCRDLYNISAVNKSELVLTWNLIVNFIHKTDLLRTLGKFPPNVRYGTVIDLIPTLSDDERELVRRFMNEYYPSRG